MNDISNREFTGQREISHRCFPGNRAGTDGLPADGDSAKRADAERKTAKRKNPGNQTAEWQQADRQSADAKRRDGHSTEGEQSADRIIGEYNPARHRFPQNIEAVADANVDER